MLCRVPAVTARVRTFAALAAVVAIGLTALADPPRSGQPRSHPAQAGPASPGPAAVFPMTGGGPGRGTITLRMGADGRFVSRTMTAPPRPPAAPALPMHTLTVRATNLAGRPDTGDGVLLLNVDNTALVDPVAAQQTFHHGTAKFSVPAGHYFAIGSFGPVRLLGVPGQPTRFIVLPQFTVTGNRTVTMHATGAVKVTMATPQPATALDTAVWLLRTGTAGPALALELYQFGHPVWISPARTKPTAGTLRAAVNQHLESPPGRAVPYEYTLSYTDPPGIISVPRYVARAKDLATVHERFYQAVPSSGGWAFNGSFPATDPNLNPSWFGFVEPTGPSLAFPGRLTEYAGGTGAGRMEWFGQYSPSPTLPSQSGDLRLLRPSQRLAENWSAYPLHPAPNVLLEHEPNMFGAVLPSALRAGNTLRLDVDPFDDNQPGHQIGVFFPVTGVRVAGTYQIDENGTKIAGGNAVTKSGPFGQFSAQATLTGRPATIRFSLDVSRASRLFPLSTASSTVWTWHTQPSGNATVPAGWTCAQGTRTRDCAVQPMMTLTYGVAGLRLNGAAPAGRQVLHVLAGHLQAVRAAPVTQLSESVSFDGGTTWHRARASGHDGSYAAVFAAPPGALVTLRTTAADAAGGTVAETITSAYRTGR